MKKNLLTFLILMVSTISLMAQIPREMVLVEIGTGTGCPYCPGAAMGLHDLYANGDPVAGIEYHSYNSGDPFNTPEAAARTSYYGISGYPTAQFDGEWGEVSGGSNTSSMYSSYLPKVNSRMAIQTDFTVEIFGDHTGDNYDIVVRVTKVGNYTGTNLAVRFALTETDIPFSWQGQSLIEYCERLMAPDENGTAVSFTGGNVQDVNLSYTFNNSWVDSNCELIAWIQDDDNKQVLHSGSVMMLALQPDVANSNFSCSNTVPCEGSSVQFNDLSTGAITSWNWTFEGGTPATSTDQNPVVTYNTQGVYDVTLYVSDGVTNSTLTNDNMMNVIVAPLQPDTPVGDVETCANTTYTYTTQPVTNADTYLWEVNPADAGTITGTGTEATFESDNSWVGAYTVSVRADNSCGDGVWSAPLNCNLNLTPVAFQLSEGGGICPGGPGLEITQDGSETGIAYDLYRDNVYTNTTLSGTGNALNFGAQTEAGTYTVMGVATMCSLLQSGTPWIHYIDSPEQPSTPTGDSEVCNNSTTDYSISAVANTDNITWILNPTDAGVISGGNLDISIEWDNNFSGTASLSAQGTNQCGDGPVSDELQITVDTAPAPVITGLSTVCDNQQSDFSVENIAGSSYEWDIVGGDVVAGAGTSNISVLWGDPGNGSVFVTETSSVNCIGSSDYFDVTIDNCTGIIENNNDNSMMIYPNPAKNDVDIAFVGTISNTYTLTIYNNIGQLMFTSTGLIDSKKQFVSISINNYQPGIYIVNISDGNGLNIKKSFEKVN